MKMSDLAAICKTFCGERRSSVFVTCMFVLHHAVVQSLGRGMRKKKLCQLTTVSKKERAKKIDKIVRNYCK